MNMSRSPVHHRLLRALHKLHLGLGLMLAAPLLIAAITGALLLLKYDFFRWTIPGAAATASNSVPVSQIALALERAEKTFSASRLKSARFADDRVGVHELWLTGDAAAYVDPQTYSVVKQWSRETDP